MKKPLSLLMITYHFPPISASSGYLRALKFAKYLPDFDIRPSILTVKTTAYETVDNKNYDLLDELNKNINVHQTFALDSSRHLSFKGKFLSWTAIPDRWVSWIPLAVIKGYLLNRKENFDALWVTFPISSALFIGYFLSKLIKKPIYVDLRDPAWEEETWKNTLQQKTVKWIEKKIIYQAEKIFFTSPGTIKKYQSRYSLDLHSKFILLPNGFDEDDFNNLPYKNKKNNNKTLFLHSGLLPIYERDPSFFFEAIKQLKQEEQVNSCNLLFRLRATGENYRYQEQVIKLGIDDLVEIADRTNYRDSLAEMFSANYLMIFQRKTCDWQTPAKLFEYFRVNKPLLLLAGENSDTHKITKLSNSTYAQADLDNIDEIKTAIKNILTTPLHNPKNNYESYSRKRLTEKLANHLKHPD
jgi:glycosyltransferase involved in cell wall biosynthesis